MQAFKQQLANKIGRVPDPADYHAGVPLPDLSLPCGINMFPRPRDIIPFYHEPKIHLSRYVLIIALRGKGCVALNNELMTLQDNTALLIFRGQLHYYVNLRVPPRQWLFISFQIEKAGAIANLRNAVTRVDGKAWRLINNLAGDYLSSRRSLPEISGHISYNLWCLLLRLSTLHTQNPIIGKVDFGADQHDYDLIAKIQGYIDTNIKANIKVNKIAVAVGISRSRLQERFHALMGMGVADYIRRHRLKHACFMMATTNESLTDIADACGFSSVYVFSRTFKNVYSITPKAYRKRMKK